MRLYRGISVPNESAQDGLRKIKSQGLQSGDGNWRMITADLKPRIDEIWRMPAITLADTRPSSDNPSWVCACGEKQGALYHACMHNRSAENDTPILIIFDADPSDVKGQSGC